jgi:hypothetical protein
MRTGAALLAVSIGLSAGCGGGAGGGGGGAGGAGAVSLAQLPMLMAQTICDQNFKCASATDIMGRLESDCVNTNLTSWQFVVGSIGDGQTAGRLTYNPAMMGTCLAKLAAESCADWTSGLDRPAECTAAVAGKVAVGGACDSDFECIGGHCDGADDSSTPPTDGACVANLAHGAACTVNDTCVTTDYCEDSTMTCAAKEPGGAACVSDDECTNSCDTTNLCSGYAGCAVAPVTRRGTLLSALALALAAAATRRRKR